MKYFSPSYIKAHPWLFAGLLLVVFGVVLLLANKGGGSGSAQYVDGGPTDAQVAAQAALAMKQLDVQGQVQLGGLQISALAQQGQNDLALANVGAQVSLAQIAASAAANSQAVAASLQVAMSQIGANVQMNADNNQFQVTYAKNAQDNALAIVNANAALTKQLSADQLKAYTTQAVLGQISSLKKKNRDEALAYLGGTILGANPDWNDIRAPVPGTSSSGGGGLFGGIIRAVSPVAGLIG